MGTSQGWADGALSPGVAWGGEEAGEGAERASRDSPTSTQSAQWHLRSPAPNSNLMRLLEAESALARHESSTQEASCQTPWSETKPRPGMGLGGCRARI